MVISFTALVLLSFLSLTPLFVDISGGIFNSVSVRSAAYSISWLKKSPSPDIGDIMVILFLISFVLRLAELLDLSKKLAVFFLTLLSLSPMVEFDSNLFYADRIGDLC